jgi:hypothetical protein
MLVRLLPWQAALRGPHDDAVELRMRGFFGDADLIDTTLLRAFFALSGEITADIAWVRALRVLLDISTPIGLDGVADRAFTVPCLRLAAVLALPPLETLMTAEQIEDTINSAIAQGAPAYNNGDARGCGIIYWATALTIVNAPTVRGFAGQARALRPLRQAVEEQIPQLLGEARAIDDFAWRMRRALDAALEAVNG